MKLLIIGAATHEQAAIAERLECLSEQDLEILELEIKLVGLDNYAASIGSADVVVLGPSLNEQVISIARHISVYAPAAQMIHFVADETYRQGNFRECYHSGIRRVLPMCSSSMDLFQELIGIHEDFCKNGRSTRGELCVVVAAKGGSGSTSVVAALGEICHENQKKVLLWDLDTSTSDLSRALSVYATANEGIESWVRAEKLVNRESLKAGVVAVSDFADVLSPPRALAEATDLSCHTDGIGIVSRIVDVARGSYDKIIVDIGAAVGPSYGALLRASDRIIVLSGGCALGVSATDLVIRRISSIVGSLDKVSILCAGTADPQQIREELDPSGTMSEKSWSLPSFPEDPRAGTWPGTGRTFYSLGSPSTRRVLEAVGQELGICSVNTELPTQKIDKIKSSVVDFVGAKKASLENVAKFQASVSSLQRIIHKS